MNNPETAGVEPVELAKAFIADYKMNMSCWPHEKALRVAANRVLGPAIHPAPASNTTSVGAQAEASTLPGEGMDWSEAADFVERYGLPVECIEKLTAQAKPLVLPSSDEEVERNSST